MEINLRRGSFVKLKSFRCLFTQLYLVFFVATGFRLMFGLVPKVSRHLTGRSKRGGRALRALWRWKWTVPVGNVSRRLAMNAWSEGQALEMTNRRRSMMKYLRALGFVAAALSAVPAAWSAEWARTAKDVNLRAGPAVEYPVIARLRAGVSISVEGCLSDYRWCDVVAGPNRGWVYAGNIVYPYQGTQVPVLTYGALIGIGIVAFTLGNYWDEHYLGRPWYPQRQYWMDRPVPRPGLGHAVPRPPGHGYRPGGPPRPPAPHFGPGGNRPPPGVRPGGGARPPQGMVPGAGRPSQGAAPGGGGRPPQGARPDGGGHRAPQGGRGPSGADRP